MSRDVTSSSVLTNHHINTSYYDSVALDIARDLVKSHTEDYFFFQYDADEWVLVFSNDARTENGFDFSAFDCTTVVIYRDDTTVPDNHSISLNGTSTEFGATPNVENISLTGSLSDSYIQSQWKIYYILNNNMHVYNTEYMVYSDTCKYMPKLREGVDYYAFAAFFLAGLIVCFRLADRIFRRVY